MTEPAEADPRLRYAQHKQNARKRGIEFDFTFEEWWEIWAPHFDKRGTARHQLQMCRTADEGAYRPGNVRIDTAAANVAEARVTTNRKAIDREWNGRGDLRQLVFKRHSSFKNPLHHLIDAEEQDEEDA